MWADDLGAFDSVLICRSASPSTVHVSGFTILMAASMFVYMRLTMANQSMPQTGHAGHEDHPEHHALTMLFFFNGFASG